VNLVLYFNQMVQADERLARRFVGRRSSDSLDLPVGGIVMTPLPTLLVAGTLAAAAAFAIILDLVKGSGFRRLRITS
jgi:hypothetical protein